MPRPLQILTSVWSINRRSRTFPILGARRADVGQRDASWVVLADPEGNEFCILGGRGSARFLGAGDIAPVSVCLLTPSRALS
ncbi:MAG: glyoxalase [Propionibacteriaceae bacterium]|jgi:hypothetical protein|nr:glyoxalase [Propionibacteriaceae bacterium]